MYSTSKTSENFPCIEQAKGMRRKVCKLPQSRTDAETKI